MIYASKDVKKSTAEKMKGGKGTLSMTHILNEGEFCGKGRLFTHTVLKPGVSIGTHPHDGEFEVYYILKGEGAYDDNGSIKTVRQGDVTLCPSGEVHALENTGTEDMEIIALILYS